jgi:hypothetical protein
MSDVSLQRRSNPSCRLHSYTAVETVGSYS